MATLSVSHNKSLNPTSSELCIQFDARRSFSPNLLNIKPYKIANAVAETSGFFSGPKESPWIPQEFAFVGQSLG